MAETVAPCVYFSEPGPLHTRRTLELARARAEALNICKILVATTSGATGVEAAHTFCEGGVDLIVVTHHAGFGAPNTYEMTPDRRAAIEAAGARILTCQHAFAGIGRAVRRKLGTYEVDEIVAYTLRTFGQGMKVCAEICLMAADAGWIRTDEPVIAVAGTGQGADTAAIIKPANVQDFFDLRFLEIICMPAPGHP